MEDGSGDQTDQQGGAVWNADTFTALLCCDHMTLRSALVLVRVSPSSTTMARFPSGERPTQVMFLVVDNGKVSEVLLEDREGQAERSFGMTPA